jgi:DNA segregation ATPase FtsK/SpoIIIE, S-DNA-T family
MFFSDKSADPRVAKNPLPPKIAALLRESWWLAFLALALYLLLILYTYRKSDPGWSHSVADAQIGNAGGVVGAYISDLMLSAFGVSAYWWVVLCGALVWWGFRRIEKVGDTDRRSYAVALAGFAVALRLSGCTASMQRCRWLPAV